ncbi:MAG TPA: glycoside hydrolase family 3 C-terminal domain-containing protein [Trebonia sp.]|nr:glycoside hydrolase family 3 C-terminal domain-containing protein [Trebonia sp.]
MPSSDPDRSTRYVPRQHRWRILAAGVAVVTMLGTLLGGLAATGADSAVRAGGAVNASCPWVTSAVPINQRVAQLLSRMTLADKISMVEGHGSANPYVYYTPAIRSLCIPAVGLEDGPAGVADGMKGVTQLPAGVTLAATWDPPLAGKYGAVIGAEQAAKGASADLGPTVNIDRDPRWGRSFEALSEDPYLNGFLAVPEIDGIQAQGVEDQVKHWDAYNQETYRNTPADNVIVDNRALHEIYMPAFYDAITKAEAASVMCAYSSVNGNASCNNAYLETTVLRDEWDFQGFVMSDFGALHATVGALDGTDQEQPESTYFGSALKADVSKGTIPVSVLNTMVSRVLTEMFRFNLFSQPRTGSPADRATTPAHVSIGTQVAEDAATLLKNQGGTLPLRGSGSVAVIGPAASASAVYGGGGSAYVIPSSTVTPLAGIRAHHPRATYTPGLPDDTSLPAIPRRYLVPGYPAKGTPADGSYTGRLTAPETGTYVLALTNPCHCYTPATLSVNGTKLIDNPGTPPADTYSAAINLIAGQNYTLSISGQSSRLLWATPSHLAPRISAAAAAARAARTAVVVVSDDTESEETDRPSLNLPSAQDELISAVVAANPRTVVVINAGAPVAMPWLPKVAAVVDAWYPGQTSGTALASVLFGQTDPGGHLPVTFPASLGQVPASTTAQFPGNGTQVLYSEGIDVGYRWYQAKGQTPLFPFGYGLSYTSFRFSGLRVETPAVTGTQDARVSATITNTGTRTGSDVAQLYLGDPSSTGEPPRQLEGFDRVTLAPGKSARLSFTVTPAQLSWWDDNANGWTQTPGTYGVYLGDSSALANLPLRGAFQVAATPGDRQVSVSAPSKLRAGQPSTVTVTLSAGGNQVLHGVRLALQLPQGWTARPDGPTAFGTVAPAAAVTARYTVTPPSGAPNARAVVHATATLGAASRENGVTVTVTPRN